MNQGILIAKAVALDEARRLDDEQLERALRDAMRERDTLRVSALRAEARRRYAGKLGLSPALMEDAE